MSLCLFKLSHRLQVTKRPLGVMFLSDKVSSGGGDDENKRTSAKNKLNDLLQSIIKNSADTTKESNDAKKLGKSVEYKLAKQVDENKIKESKKARTADPNNRDNAESISQNLLKAVKDVAENISGKGDPEVVESELVQKLKTQNNNKVDLRDIFAGMKIDRTKKAPEHSQSHELMETSRAERVKRMLEQRRPRQFDRSGGEWSTRRKEHEMPRERRKPVSQAYTRIDLFGQPPLGIFTINPDKPPPNVPDLTTWDKLHQRELKLAVTHPPANGFEEMILLTEQGKLWKFPIDNDYGRDEEDKIPFHEHIFLEPLIEGWCPKRGPIRHFMELVCVGLSKNPWLSVKEKHDHLEWYHQYFLSKAALIKEVGAGEIK